LKGLVFALTLALLGCANRSSSPPPGRTQGAGGRLGRNEFSPRGSANKITPSRVVFRALGPQFFHYARRCGRESRVVVHLNFFRVNIRNKNTRALPLLWGTRSRTPWPDVFDHWNGLTIVIVYNLIWPGSRPTHVDPWIRGRRLDMESIQAHSDGLEQNRQRGRQFGPA